MKIAITFDNLGHYHVARLKELACRSELLVFEVSSKSCDYAWDTPLDIDLDLVSLSENINSKFSIKEKILIKKDINDKLNDFNPDIVIIPGWSSFISFYLVLWANRNNKKIIVLSDSQEIDCDRNMYKEHIKSIFLRYCDAALVAGSNHYDYLVKLGFNCEFIRLGYDVVDNDYFKNQSNIIRGGIEQYRIKYNLPDKYFLLSNRLIHKKNVEFVIDTYLEYYISMKENGSDPWKLVILGDGILKTNIINKINDNNVQDYIILKGNQSYGDLPIYYSLAKVFILASVVDQWGLVVNEAMASGLPVLVSSNCGCARDLVKEHVNGFIFNPRDKQELVNHLISFHEQKYDITCMSNKSVDIINKWGVDIFAKNIIFLSEKIEKSNVKYMNLIYRVIFSFMALKSKR